MELVYLAIGIVIGGLGVLLAFKVAGNSALSKARLESEQIKNNALTEVQNRTKEMDSAFRQEQIKRKEQFERETENKKKRIEKSRIPSLQAGGHAGSQAGYAFGQGKESGRSGIAPDSARQGDGRQGRAA